MSYEILDLVQGTQEWLEARKRFHPASEAASAMGKSKYKKRDAYLREVYTGEREEPNEHLQKLFQRGHDMEDRARPLIEAAHNVKLDNLVCVRKDLLASYDGIDLSCMVGWEHKLWNEKLASYMVEYDDLPDTHWPQVEQQIYVTGLNYVLFTTSDEEREITIKYYSRPERQQAVIDAWAKFDEDLAAMTDEDAQEDETVWVVREDAAFLNREIIYADLQNKIKELEKEAGAIKKELVEMSEGFDTKGQRVTISQSERKSIDNKRLLGDNPQIDVSAYERITKVVTVRLNH